MSTQQLPAANKPSTRSRVVQLSKPFQPLSDEPNKATAVIKIFPYGLFTTVIWVHHKALYIYIIMTTMRAILPHELDINHLDLGNAMDLLGQTHNSLVTPGIHWGGLTAGPTLGSGLPAQVEDMAMTNRTSKTSNGWNDQFRG